MTLDKQKQMAMNTTHLQQRSSWGRIVQMMRVDFYTQQRGMIFTLGALALIIFVLPRLPLLYSDVSYKVWARSIAVSDGVYSTIMMAISSFFGTLMSLVYLNRRVLHSHPIAFALLPARLWEKIVSIILSAIAICLSAMLVFAVSELFNMLTIGGYTSAVIHFVRFDYMSPLNLEGANTVAIVLFLLQLASMLSGILVAISFRRLRVGIFVYFLGWTIALVFGSVVLTYSLDFFLNLSTDTAIEVSSYVVMTISILINAALAWGIYYRLRTLEC